MTPLLYKTYQDLVITESQLSEQLPSYGQKTATYWIKGALNPQEHLEEVEKVCAYFIDFMIQQDLYHPPLRYQFSSQSAREELLKIIFHKSFENAGEALISLAEEIASPQSFSDSHWKKVLFIQAPETLAYLFQNKMFQYFCAMSVVIASCYLGKRCYFSFTSIFKNRLSPFLIKKLPLPAIQIGHHIFTVVEKIDSLRKKNFKSLFLLALICSFQPNILPARIAPSLKLIIKILFTGPQTAFSFLLETSFTQAVHTFIAIGRIGTIFSSIAAQNKTYYINSSRVKAEKIWNEMVHYPRK